MVLMFSFSKQNCDTSTVHQIFWKKNLWKSAVKIKNLAFFLLDDDKAYPIPSMYGIFTYTFG